MQCNPTVSTVKSTYREWLSLGAGGGVKPTRHTPLFLSSYLPSSTPFLHIYHKRWKNSTIPFGPLTSDYTSIKMDFSADMPEQAHFSPKITLEDLPCEIKVMILCQLPKLSSLSSIVHASPAYHQAYLGAREAILHTITVRTLQKNDIGILDPWTAIHASQPGEHIINEYLDRYAQGRIDGSRRLLAPMDSLAILSLQGKFTFLIAKFCKDRLSKNPFTGSLDDDPPPLSQSELHRLYRAFWRYELYSSFFGPSEQASPRGIRMHGVGPWYPTFSENDITDAFFRLFPIHEVEELACLQKWAKEYYFGYAFSGHGDQLVALGPQKLYEVMTVASEMERETRIAEDDKPRPNATMRDALDAYERDVTWGTWQWKDMYEKFNSARVPSTGWLWASSNGQQNTDFRLRRWGYVFWDQERLDHWGIRQENMVNWPNYLMSCVVRISSIS